MTYGLLAEQRHFEQEAFKQEVETQVRALKSKLVTVPTRRIDGVLYQQDRLTKRWYRA